MKLKFLTALIIIGIVAIAAALFLVYYNAKQEQAVPEGEGQIIQVKEIIPPKATGNIDDAVDALIKEAEDEENQALGEDGELPLLTVDSQTISDFGQSYNEKDF